MCVSYACPFGREGISRGTEELVLRERRVKLDCEVVTKSLKKKFILLNYNTLNPF